MDNNQHKDLDKFFQNKLNERQFEYQDDFWSEMETLLPEESTDTVTTGHSRHRFIWGTLLIFLIGFTGWLAYPYSIGSNETNTNAVLETQETTSSTSATSKQKSDNLLTNINTKNKENQINNSDFDTNETTKKTINNQTNTKQSTKNIELKKYDKIKKVDNKTNQFSKEDLIQSNSSNSKEGIFFPSNIFDNSVDNSTKETKSTIEGDKPLAVLPDIYKEKNDVENQINNNSTESENATKEGNSTVSDNSKNNYLSDYIYLKTLNFERLSTKETTEISKIEPNCDGCPQLPDLKRINIGLITGLSVSQGWKNTLSSRANASLDPTIGLRFEYASNPIADWTFGTEIIYWSRSSLNAQYGYDSTSYGFGATTVSRNINIEELHNIALPIYAVYNKDKHEFMAGLNINYIINAQSTTTGNGSSYNANNVELFNVTTTQQWGYTSAFNRFDIGLTLGYDYEIRDGWKLGTRINYGLTDVAKNNVFDNNTFDNNLNIRLLLTCDLLEFKL
ncbi:MAG: outer membrane beta-barrel protein [Saprospiraceae bacterium]